MSGEALGQVIAPALGIAISPVSIVAIILLLLSDSAKSAGIGFLLGWTAGIVAAVTAFALLSGVVPTRVPGAAHTVVAVIQLVVGVLLLALTAALWRRRRGGRRRGVDADGLRPNGWIRAVDKATFPIAFGVGFVMAVNPPNLLLSLAGGVAIGMSGLAGGGTVLALAAFTFVAGSTVLAPVVVHSIAADRLERPLDILRLWLTRHGSAILTGVFVILGLVSVSQGLSALPTR